MTTNTHKRRTQVQGTIPLLYICGPYSDDPAVNANEALHWAERVAEAGLAVFCPHVAFYGNHEKNRVLAIDLAVMCHCDGLLVFGEFLESEGALLEMSTAIRLGKPVFYEEVPTPEDIARMTVHRQCKGHMPSELI